MGTNGNVYERELKGILAGDDAVLRRVVRGLDPRATADYLQAAERPFLVVRGAGSLGVDLVALRGDVSFPIEVKSAASDVIRFSDDSGRNMEQAVAMRAECARAGVLPLYAFRRKGLRGADPWRVYTLPTDGLDGRLRVLHGRLPKAGTTPRGSLALRWEDGLALHRFLDYLCRPTDAAPSPVRVVAADVAARRL